MGQKLKKNSSSCTEQDGAQLAWNVNSSCSDLHMLEVYFYVLMWIGAVGYAAYSTFKITRGGYMFSICLFVYFYLRDYRL